MKNVEFKKLKTRHKTTLLNLSRYHWMTTGWLILNAVQSWEKLKANQINKPYHYHHARIILNFILWNDIKKLTNWEPFRWFSNPMDWDLAIQWIGLGGNSRFWYSVRTLDFSFYLFHLNIGWFRDSMLHYCYNYTLSCVYHIVI